MRKEVTPVTAAILIVLLSLTTQGCGKNDTAEFFAPAQELLESLDNCGFTEEHRATYVPNYPDRVQFYGSSDSVTFTTAETSTTLGDLLNSMMTMQFQEPGSHTVELLLGLALTHQDNPCLNSIGIRLDLAQITYEARNQTCIIDSSGTGWADCSRTNSIGTLDAIFQIVKEQTDNAVRLFERQHSAINELATALNQFSAAVDAAGFERTTELNETMRVLAEVTVLFDSILSESADAMMTLSEAPNTAIRTSTEILPIARSGLSTTADYTTMTNALNLFAETAELCGAAMSAFVEQSQLPITAVLNLESLATTAQSDYDFRPGSTAELHRAAIRLQDVLVDILPQYGQAQTALQYLDGALQSNLRSRVQWQIDRIERLL